MNKINAAILEYPQLRMNSVGYVRLGKFWNSLNLGGHYWRLYYHDSPGAGIYAGRKKVELQPDRVYLLPPNCDLETWCTGEPVQLYLHFEMTQLAGNPDCFLTVERDTISLQHREIPCEPVEWELERTPICRFGEFLLQAERVKRTDETLDLQNRDPMTVFFSLDLPRKLIVSPRRDGDRMIPFGKHHALLVKKLCSEGGIKAYSRNSHPLLRTEEGEILWFPGVRRSASYPVAESAGEMWRIRARRTPPEREAMTRKKD